MPWRALSLAAFRLDDGGGDDAALHPVERRRAAALPAGMPRERFLSGRRGARLLAAGLLGVDAADLELDYACVHCGACGAVDHGRPGYRRPGDRDGVRLSLSRTGPWCLLAGTADPSVAAVGVDVDDRARMTFPGFDDVALTPAERSVLDGIRTEGEASRMRARLWSRKEAFLKATGSGLLRDPADVDVLSDSLEGIELEDLVPLPLGLPGELTAAIAVRRAG